MFICFAGIGIFAYKCGQVDQKKKLINPDTRIDVIANLYRIIEETYTEQNRPTDIATFAQEVIEGMYKHNPSILKCNVEHIFKNEIEVVRRIYGDPRRVYCKPIAQK